MKLARSLCLSSTSLAVALLAGSLAAASVEAGSVAPPAGLQEALLSVNFNGAAADEPVVLLRAAGGKLYAASELLQSWRLLPGDAPTLIHGGIRYHLLNAVPGLRVELDEASQELKLTAITEAIGMTRLAYARVEPTDEVVAGNGGFLNYDATAEMSAGEASLAGAIEAGIFSRLGVGLTSFVSRWSGHAFELTRLATNWTVDDPVKMRSLRFGDSISRSGVGGVPLHFGGIQLARSFAMQPGFVTIPLPSVRGSAAVPSVVDIYVNDALAGSRDVPPGPFEITDVPIVTGNGEVQLVVRDLLGRERLYSQPYYAVSQQLRKGLDDYSYEAGFLRRSYGRASNDYGGLMVSATHRYGFTNSLTGEIHAEATRRVQAAGVAANLVLPAIGHVQGSVAASRSPLGKARWPASASNAAPAATRSQYRANSPRRTTCRWDAARTGCRRRRPSRRSSAFRSVSDRSEFHTCGATVEANPTSNISAQAPRSISPEWEPSI